MTATKIDEKREAWVTRSGRTLRIEPACSVLTDALEGIYIKEQLIETVGETHYCCATLEPAVLALLREHGYDVHRRTQNFGQRRAEKTQRRMMSVSPDHQLSATFLQWLQQHPFGVIRNTPGEVSICSLVLQIAKALPDPKILVAACNAAEADALRTHLAEQMADICSYQPRQQDRVCITTISVLRAPERLPKEDRAEYAEDSDERAADDETECADVPERLGTDDWDPDIVIVNDVLGAVRTEGDKLNPLIDARCYGLLAKDATPSLYEWDLLRQTFGFHELLITTTAPDVSGWNVIDEGEKGLAAQVEHYLATRASGDQSNVSDAPVGDNACGTTTPVCESQAVSPSSFEKWGPLAGYPVTSEAFMSELIQRWKERHDGDEKEGMRRHALEATLEGNWFGPIPQSRSEDETDKDRSIPLHLVAEDLVLPFTWDSPRKIIVTARYGRFGDRPSGTDLFHAEVPIPFSQALARIMEQAHWHTYYVLSRWPDRMAHLLENDLSFAAGLKHVYWGVTCRSMDEYDHRVGILRRLTVSKRIVCLDPYPFAPFDRIDVAGLDAVLVRLDGHQEAEAVATIRRRCLDAGVPFGIRKLPHSLSTAVLSRDERLAAIAQMQNEYGWATARDRWDRCESCSDRAAFKRWCGPTNGECMCKSAGCPLCTSFELLCSYHARGQTDVIPIEDDFSEYQYDYETETWEHETTEQREASQVRALFDAGAAAGIEKPVFFMLFPNVPEAAQLCAGIGIPAPTEEPRIHVVELETARSTIAATLRAKGERFAEGMKDWHKRIQFCVVVVKWPKALDMRAYGKKKFLYSLGGY